MAKHTALATALRIPASELTHLDTFSENDLAPLTNGINHAVTQREQQLRDALQAAGKFIPGPLLRTIKKRFF